MNLGAKIINQSLIYFLGTIFSVFIGFIFKIYIANNLGAESLGLFTLGMSVVSILSIFLSLGFGNGLVKFISEYNATGDFTRMNDYLRKQLP